MRWTENKNARGFYDGKKGGFEFTITCNGGRHYVVASHLKKDIRLNTLWIDTDFDTFEDAEIFCENFKWKQYVCIGDDV